VLALLDTDKRATTAANAVPTRSTVGRKTGVYLHHGVQLRFPQKTSQTSRKV